MADSSIDNLTTGTPALTDYFPYSEAGGGSTATKKALISTFGGTFVENELVSGSGTTFTLANTPIAGSVKVFGLRNRLYLTTDYTISGSVITTVDTYSAGDIMADYRK
jgi:hypothetical protein